MIRVLLVDDDDRVRRGWQMRLALEPDIVVVGTAGDMTTAIPTAAAAQPHVILLDIELPGSDGLSGIAALRQAAPQTAIIIVTVYDSATHRRQALLAGAAAFISKQADFDQLLALMRRVGSL